MKFTVVVTRDTTESAFITVEAEDEDTAKDLALKKSGNLDFRQWYRDYAALTDGYVTGCDEVEE